MAAKRKLTLYFPEEMVRETKELAEQHERSVSWILQAAWRLSKEKLRRMPSANDPKVPEEATAKAG